MPDETVRVEAFDPQAGTEADWQALNTLQNRVQAERWPDDPPRPVAETVTRWRVVPAFVDLRTWVARDGAGSIVGGAALFMLRTEENAHIGQTVIEVLPEARHRGIGRALLGAVAGAAEEAGRRLLIADTHSGCPAGAAFLERAGGQRGLDMVTNQLVLAEVDPALLETWQARAQQRAAGFTLGLWEGPYPEAELPAIARLLDAANEAPRGNLEYEDLHWTPEQLRQDEAQLAAMGSTRWTMYVREDATGTLAGYTEVHWRPTRPAAIQQGYTAVWPAYRNQGLGRWLKAAMIAKILRERPGVRTIRTGNAEVNAPMLHINQELGFRPYASETLWQLEVAAARAYLRS